MIRSLKLTGLGLGCLVLASCASPTVYPEKDGTYTLVSTSSYSSSANKAAKKKATKVCGDEARNLEVVKVDEVYQGVDKTAGAAMNVASSLVASLAGGYSQSSNSENDYKVTLNFRCV